MELRIKCTYFLVRGMRESHPGMFPKVITGNRAQKMGELGRTPEQEAQTSEEKGLCRGNTEEEGAWGAGIPRRHVPTPSPALAFDVQPWLVHAY